MYLFLWVSQFCTQFNLVSVERGYKSVCLSRKPNVQKSIPPPPLISSFLHFRNTWSARDSVRRWASMWENSSGVTSSSSRNKPTEWECTWRVLWRRVYRTLGKIGRRIFRRWRIDSIRPREFVCWTKIEGRRNKNWSLGIYSEASIGNFVFCFWENFIRGLRDTRFSQIF